MATGNIRADSGFARPCPRAKPRARTRARHPPRAATCARAPCPQARLARGHACVPASRSTRRAAIRGKGRGRWPAGASDEEGRRSDEGVRRGRRLAAGRGTEGERRGGSSSSGGRTAVAPARGSTSWARPALVTQAAMEGDLLRSPPMLHARESSIGEWKALEMENAVV